MGRVVAWAGIAVGAAYLTFIGGAWFGIYYPSLRLLSVLFAAIAIGGWWLLAGKDSAWRPRSVLMPAIGACLASLAISTLLSRRPGISLEYLAYAVVLAALYLLLVRLMAVTFFQRRLVRLAIGLFLAIAIADIGLTVAHWGQWLSVLGTIDIPPLRPEYESLMYGTPSTVLTMVALLAIPAVSSAPWTTRRGLLVTVGVLAVVAFVAIITGSRAGWLALAIAGLVGIVIVIARTSVRSQLRERMSSLSRMQSAGLAGGVGLVAIVGMALAPAVLGRLTAGGEANRLTFVRTALELFRESPIVGAGPGTWVIERPRLTLTTEVDEYIPHAHNIYAQTLAELGLVGLVAGGVLVFALTRLVVGVAIREPDSGRQRWAWVTLIGLVYLAAHQVLDFYPNFPAVLFAAALPVAYLDATSPVQTRPPATDRRSSAAAFFGLVALGVAVVLLVAQEVPALAAARAVDHANAGRWAAADAPAREAAQRDPRVASYLFTAGLTAAHAGDHAAARDYFARVTAGDDLPEAWLNLAAEQAMLGEHREALASLRSALRLGRQRPAVSVPAGDLALRLGDRALAIEAWTAAAAVSPSLLADPWWDGDVTRAGVRAEVAATAVTSLPPGVAWELALMGGDPDVARRLAAEAGLDGSAFDFVDAWGGNEAAYERLIDRCTADALNIRVLFLCARIEGMRGNVEAANDWRYLANAQIGGAYAQGAELRVATEPMVGRSLAGNPAIFWGTYTYRRFTPWDVLVPSLVHLTLR